MSPASGPPPEAGGAVAWLRKNLFSGWLSGLATLAILALVVSGGIALLRWAVLEAIFRADAGACQVLDHAGACWGVIAEKYRLILFGRYPAAEQWRPAIATALLVAALGFSAFHRRVDLLLVALWGLAATAFFVLMAGGAAGLAPVRSDLWGGLPLTLLLSIGSVLAAFPLGVALAYGRCSSLPVLRAACTLYIELLRALPLVSVLFLAAFLVPLLTGEGRALDKLPRLLAAIALFSAAYLAEVVRGGLLAVPVGQRQAAAALGLRWWQIQRWIVLPQALRVATPSLVNSFIGALKETSLVTVVSMYELTGALSLALGGDPVWRPFFLEGYLFIGAIYWLFCFSLSRYSRRLEGAHPVS